MPSHEEEQRKNVIETESVKVLSTPQFESAVFAMEAKTAVFDCDGTLWSGDAGSAFLAWSIEKRLISPEAIAWINQRYTGYNEGRVSELVMCGEMVQVYQGVPEADIRRSAAEFFKAKIHSQIFPEMEQLIARLQQSGATIWAVSSTCDWVVEEGVKHFGIPADHVLASRVEVRDGTATNRLLDVPTDAGKVASLARMGVDRPDVVFGNSVHDAAMLLIAQRAFPVNPSPALIERSAIEGWAIYFPASVQQPNFR